MNLNLLKNYDKKIQNFNKLCHFIKLLKKMYSKIFWKIITLIHLKNNTNTFFIVILQYKKYSDLQRKYLYSCK